MPFTIEVHPEQSKTGNNRTDASMIKVRQSTTRNHIQQRDWVSFTDTGSSDTDIKELSCCAICTVATRDGAKSQVNC